MSTSWSRCFGSSMRLEHIAGLGESPEDRCEMEDNIAKNICQEIATLPFNPDPPYSELMNATGVFLITLDLVKASRVCILFLFSFLFFFFFFFAFFIFIFILLFF